MKPRFIRKPTAIAGVEIIERLPLHDDRGYLERLYCASELSALTQGRPIVQINHSLTRRQGTVRGLHLQYSPHAETKLVTCLRGQVFDVAVDLRQGSASFLHWHGEPLSADNHRSLLIPAGCAHGFQTLTDDCELLYLHTACHVPEAEGGFNPTDPRLAIQWPRPIAERSTRDAAHPWIDAHFEGIQT